MNYHRPSTIRTSGRPRGNSAGFTLIELAIALVVVSMIVGAVVAGKYLADRAKLNSVAEDASKVQTAIAEFQATFNSIPGDMYDASTRLKAQGKYPTLNGDGDGILETYNTNGDNELMIVMQHLALAGLIEGEYDGIHTQPGTGLMESGFGEQVAFEMIATGGRVQVQVSRYESGSGKQSFLTPQQSQSLDERFDDGNPETGKIQAYTGSNAPSDADCRSGSRYQLRDDRTLCYVTILAASGDVAADRYNRQCPPPYTKQSR